MPSDEALELAAKSYMHTREGNGSPVSEKAVITLARRIETLVDRKVAELEAEFASFREHHTATEQERDRLKVCIATQRGTLAFFRSVIKCGEPWTDRCEEAWADAARGDDDDSR